MKVKLTINLGTHDLIRYGLEKGMAGDVVDVTEDHAIELVDRSCATDADADGPPAKLRAVPPVEIKAKPVASATKPPPPPPPAESQ